MTGDPIYEPVIGLEVHAQLLTKSKIFCNCPAEFTDEPNLNVCPVCLGHPGVLPVLNKTAVEFAIMMGIATNCRINSQSFFARKNYFYPDLPKGYQISQFEKPLCEAGYFTIVDSEGFEKRIGITRIHLEEDAGKSIHDSGEQTSIDVNRCGTPLIEIVSEPDIRSAKEASAYLEKLRQVLQYLGICDGNMEQGSFRCDANVSVRVRGAQTYGTKTELKNMNSFRNVERAINFEISRQIVLLDEGKPVVQETLLWDPEKEAAIPMRSKEESHDYRYFPEPDLLPVTVSNDWLEKIKARIPELPDERKERFINEYQIPEYDAGVLTSSRTIADYFEELASAVRDYKLASNWVMVEVMGKVNELKTNFSEFPVQPEKLARLLNLIKDGTLSNKIAKEVFNDMIATGDEADEIVKKKDLVQISDTGAILVTIDKVVKNHQKELGEYLQGKDKVIGFFVGKIMKETDGKANPKIVNDLLKEYLLNIRKTSE